MLKHTRITILLSINAIAVLIVGVRIADAISSGDGGNFGTKIVDERSDVVDGFAESTLLTDASSENTEGETKPGSNNSSDGEAVYPESPGGEVSSGVGALKKGQLWAADSMTIYLSADKDVCIDTNEALAGDMYWQTSNSAVISAFYQTSREYLGFSAERCRFPQIMGVGETVITAGTNDGLFRDSIRLNVVPIPVADWKHEVLRLVNAERSKVGVAPLGAGDSCVAAADIRAREIVQRYDHVRPNGSAWSTACPIPAEGGASGENIHAGNSAVSPAHVVREWMASPTHRANILDGRFTRLVVGFYFDVNSQYRIYWTQYFSSY